MKGSIQKRGDRVYRIRLDAGRDEKGRRIQKSVTVHGTRKEAARKTDEVLRGDTRQAGRVATGDETTL